MSPITPNTVRKILKGANKSSSPGEDSITYHHLWKLPSTHHFLATLFSKILLDSQSAPQQWCTGIIKLIYKDGTPEDPKNFRPIALTSCVGKTFHKILAIRLENFLLDNHLIDPSIQKGFLRNCPGTYEHIFALNAILDQARQLDLPTIISFLDLKNAFGSVPHQLVFDILQHIRIPSGIINYIRDCYSQLTAHICTDTWSTPKFTIQKGVFQGDTMSPVIFLAVFSPVIERIQKLQYPSCPITIPIVASENLPPVGSCLYVLWNEDSNEERGWYRCTVAKHLLDGSSLLEYPDGQSETVNIQSCEWRFAKKSNRKFVSLNSSLPPEPTNKPSTSQQYYQSSEHKCKALADDLTIPNRSRSDHQETLRQVEEACNSMGLTLNPSKCVSITIENGKPKPKATYHLRDGQTRNLCSAPTKFLGHTIASTPQESKRRSSTNLKNHVISILKRIDDRPIRGEMKIWIVRNYLIPSLQYQLAVNHTSKSCILHLENEVTKLARKWLKLPRSATRVILHHPSSINVPPLTVSKIKAKLSYLCCITETSDPAIKEISVLINDNSFLTRQDISKETHQHLRNASTIATSPSSIRPTAKRLVDEQALQDANQKLNSLQVQKKFADCMELEAETKVWRHIVDGLPAGQLSFILRCSSDTLPSTNLRRWKIQMSARCKLCDAPQATALHVLNGCKQALEDGRYTWRHDSVLLKIVAGLRNLLPPSNSIFADLPNLRADESPPATVPPQLLCTSARPDIVICKDNVVQIIELTVCSNNARAMLEAKRRKESKELYQALLNDLLRRDIKASYLTIEVGALGHHPPGLPHRLASLFGMNSQHRQFRMILEEAAKISISSSQIIFWARGCQNWESSKPLLQ